MSIEPGKKMAVCLVSICLMGTFSCTIPKEARQLKNDTKDWRESSAVLEAYADSPVSGVFLTLRENGKFEHKSTGILRSFEAGTWANNQDTISLSYLDNKQSISYEKKVLIERESSTLIFEGDDTPTQLRLKIMLNKL